MQKPYIESGILHIDIDGRGHKREISIVKCKRERYSTIYWIVCEEFIMVSIVKYKDSHFITGTGAKKYEDEILKIIEQFEKSIEKQKTHRKEIRSNNVLRLVKKEE